MSYDLQKADIWKRASAFLLDLILTAIAIVGFIFLLSLITGTNKHYEAYESRMDHYEALHGVDFEKISDRAAYEALTEEERVKIDAAWGEFSTDGEALRAYNLIINSIMVNASLGILLAFLLTEFAVPMLLKNGQTVGKKVFGIGVMRLDGVKISGQILFIRSILGKCTVETMIPALMLAWIMLGQAGFMAVVIIALVVIGNLVMMAITRTNSGIHDMLASTVTVDLSSQLIFDSPEALLEYKQKIHAEEAERARY
jgi:uncharacterized RDD family membrane protein YckC